MNKKLITKAAVVASFASVLALGAAGFASADVKVEKARWWDRDDYYGYNRFYRPYYYNYYQPYYYNYYRPYYRPYYHNYW